MTTHPGLDRDQIIDLLSVIAAYDRRQVGEGDLAAWAEASRRAGWTFQAAVDAVHSHFADSSAWLMPGHVTERIRLQRRQPAPADEVLALAKPVASAERRAEFMAQLRDVVGKKSIR